MTSIAPVSLNNIETQWRCGLKSIFSGEVHSRKRILLHVFQEVIYSTSAVQQPRTMNGRNFFLTAVQDVISSYYRISVFAGVSRNAINY